MNKLGTFIASCVTLAVLMNSGTAGAQTGERNAIHAESKGRHLFILSGQSNMTGGLKAGFAGIVEAAFGKENVTIVHQCKPGRGIRFWDKDYKFSDPSKPSGKDKQQGELYAPLLDAIRSATKDKSYDTVTFIWMQGESDGLRSLGAAYEQSFLRLLERLKTDLNRKDMNFVIGRISDHDMNNPGWRKVREVQMKLGETHERCGWIDTDDLNGGEAGKPGGDLHYPKDKIGILGERFAAKAVELISKKPAKVLNQEQGKEK